MNQSIILLLKAPPSINNELKIGTVITKPALVLFPLPEPTTSPSPLTSIPELGPPEEDVWLRYGKEVFVFVSRYKLSGARPVHCPIGFN
jgi:hypothetical protein